MYSMNKTKVLSNSPKDITAISSWRTKKNPEDTVQLSIGWMGWRLFHHSNNVILESLPHYKEPIIQDPSPNLKESW